MPRSIPVARKISLAANGRAAASFGAASSAELVAIALLEQHVSLDFCKGVHATETSCAVVASSIKRKQVAVPLGWAFTGNTRPTTTRTMTRTRKIITGLVRATEKGSNGLSYTRLLALIA